MNGDSSRIYSDSEDNGSSTGKHSSNYHLVARPVPVRVRAPPTKINKRKLPHKLPSYIESASSTTRTDLDGLRTTELTTELGVVSPTTENSTVTAPEPTRPPLYEQHFLHPGRPHFHSIGLPVPEQSPSPSQLSYFDHRDEADGLFSIGSSRTPPTSGFGGSTSEKSQSRWTSFLAAVTVPDTYEGGIIDEKLLEEQSLDGKWVGYKGLAHHHHLPRPHKKRKGKKNDDETPYVLTSRYLSTESRRMWKPRLNFILLNNPYVPLTLRMSIFILSVAALALACSVMVQSRNAMIAQQPSTIMAIVVQSTALVYLVYITYDEYSSKPIGLRQAKAKMRLIMLDLLFIIFSSANLSLTFNTLFDVAWTCKAASGSVRNDPNVALFYVPYNFAICSRQRALASFLFMVLVMWVSTFTISIFRLVERVTPGD
jgi:hypothetical protein